jgi:hypothetical protein
MWGPPGLIIFPDFSKAARTCKFKMDILWFSNNSQLLHEARLEYSEQLLNCVDF